MTVTVSKFRSMQIYEPVHEKTNNLGFDLVPHKPASAAIEDG